MATEIEKVIAENLKRADREWGEASKAWRRANRRREDIYLAATEVLSQRQVAEMTGISQQRVSQIIRHAKARRNA